MQMRPERQMTKREFHKWLIDQGLGKHFDAPMLRMLARLCDQIELLPPTGRYAEEGLPYSWVRLVFVDVGYSHVHWNQWDSFESFAPIADALFMRVRILERQLREERKKA